MSNRSLVHIRINDGKIIASYLHWLKVDNDWVIENYDEVMLSLSQLVTDNMSDIEKVTKTIGKSAFRKLAGSSVISVAYSVSTEETTSHSVITMRESANELLCRADMSLVIWISPPEISIAGRKESWPIECAC